jgi:MoxR-like ATPase
MQEAPIPAQTQSSQASFRWPIKEPCSSDEIDCLAPKAQIGLLRFLQEKEYKSLGSPEIRKCENVIEWGHPLPGASF